MASITIPKDYFETLIRRAELHHTSDDEITIPRAEYNALIQFHGEYQSLRTALLAGGATPETLNVLINAPPPTLKEPSGHPWSTDAPAFISATAQSFQKCRIRASSSGNWPTDPSPISVSPDSYSFEDEKSSVTSSEKAEDVKVGDAIEDCGEKQGIQGNDFENNHEDRTILLTGLSNRATLADITKAIRGGQLLNLYIREHEHTAHVSFVDPMAAEAFLLYAKRTDLYIRGKRVEISWSERQRFMPGHVDHKIVRFGASRNLVIRFPKSDMTPESIRDDLEHIHNLEVVDVTTLAGGHILISTNDVSLAVTARTCMGSRLKYKGSRVEFYPDQCCEPLPPIARKTLEGAPSSPKKTFNVNRFQMLASMGGEEEEVDW